MATVSFSRSAKADLLSIGAYTLQTWGAAQAERYIGSLEACAKLLAGNPALGRPCGWIRPGLYRFEKGRHVFFYRWQEDGISRFAYSASKYAAGRSPFRGCTSGRVSARIAEVMDGANFLHFVPQSAPVASYILVLWENENAIMASSSNQVWHRRLARRHRRRLYLCQRPHRRRGHRRLHPCQRRPRQGPLHRLRHTLRVKSLCARLR